ncbi:hypothetical protein GBAR_LOCUS15151, partial [Geodia barretti]
MASTSASTSVCDVSAEIDSEESSFDNDEQETTEERDTTTTSEASSSTVVSLLERLRAPKKSELTSKRKIFANPPREPGLADGVFKALHELHDTCSLAHMDLKLDNVCFDPLTHQPILID